MPTDYGVVVLTPRHSISGILTLHELRLSDFLNDRRDTAMTLQNTQLSRLTDPGKILQQHATAVLPKQWAVIAFEPPQQAIPYAKRLYGYVRKQQYQIFMILDGMNVRGTLHTQGELELRRLMATTSDSFVPITQATVTLHVNDRFVIEQDAIMVNTRLIRYIAEVTQNEKNTP